MVLHSSHLILKGQVFLSGENLVDQFRVIVEKREGLLRPVEDIRYVLIDLIPDHQMMFLER
jgi:hypothetical protein